MKTIGKNVSENVRRLRNNLNLSQQELAEKAEISFRGLQDIEYGKAKNPRSDTIASIAMALGVTTEELFRDPNSPITEKAESNLNSQVKEALAEALKQSLSKEQLELLALIQGLSASEAESIVQIIRARLARPSASSDNDKLASNK